MIQLPTGKNQHLPKQISRAFPVQLGSNPKVLKDISAQ